MAEAEAARFTALVEQVIEDKILTGPPGQSAYQLWLAQEGNEGKSEGDFLISLVSTVPSIVPGPRGASAYDAWIELGNSGTIEEFITAMKVKGDGGDNGLSAFEQWLAAGNVGDEATFLSSLVGLTAYQQWLAEGNVGTVAEFFASLKGSNGQSAYELWLSMGNEGTPQEFLHSFKGLPGDNGFPGSKIHRGPVNPTNELGMASDLFINETTGDLLQRDEAGWTLLFRLALVTVEPPPPPPPPPDDALPGDIVNAEGVVSMPAYLDMAYKLIQTQGIQYRFGSPAPAVPQGFPTLPEREDAGFINHGGGNNVYFSHGPEDNNGPNLYMTVNGTAIGKPNSSTSLYDAIRWCQVAAVDRETWQQRPQRLWQDNVALPPDVSYYESLNLVEYNDPADLPVCTFRASGADAPSTRLSLVCTQGSPTRPARMFTSGTYTANNRALCEFELGFVPTAIAVTGGGELALVTGWDTVNGVGKVAVVCLGSTSNGSPLFGSRYTWWNGWEDVMHPGMFDQGNWIFMKVQGYVTLPGDCKAPTSIACSTGHNPIKHVAYDGNGEISGFERIASPMADNLARMQPGGDFYECYAKGGLAIVGCKSEKKLVFIDLTPWFEYINGMYLGSAASNLLTLDMGFEPEKWPYAFSHMPTSTQPVVVKTVTLMKPVQDVMMTTDWCYHDKDHEKRRPPPDDMYWEPDPYYARAGAVTPDGEFHLFSTGRYLPGHAPTTGREPSDIAPVGTISGLGDNITCLFALEQHPDVPQATNGGVGFLDRQNRKIGLVKFTTPADGLTTSLTVQTIVQDSRMVDPLHATISDPYHTVGNLVCVADHGASKLRNYRYGDVTYGGNTVWSPAPTLSPEGEYCGDLDCAFKPIQVFASNVP
jgi:hypothetical protein